MEHSRLSLCSTNTQNLLSQDDYICGLCSAVVRELDCPKLLSGQKFFLLQNQSHPRQFLNSVVFTILLFSIIILLIYSTDQILVQYQNINEHVQFCARFSHMKFGKHPKSPQLSGCLGEWYSRLLKDQAL